MTLPFHWPASIQGVLIFLTVLLLTLSNASAARNDDSLSLEFEDWVILHQKHYATDAEWAARRAVYQANCKAWELLNQIPGGAFYSPQGEPNADVTVEEFVQRMANCASCYDNDVEEGDDLLKSAKKVSVVSQRRRRRRRHMLEDKDNTNIVYVDWRNKDGISYVTPIKNQGAFGTCWSFAAAENLEGLNVRQGYPLVNISEQEFISCCSTCQGRAEEATLEWLVNATGGRPALEESYPYNGSKNVSCNLDAPRAPLTLHSWGRIQDDGTGMQVLLGLGTKGPMSLGVDARCFFGYHHGIIRNCTIPHGGHGQRNHAVLMVAAGADALQEEGASSPSSFVDYFTIKNSWGPRFGEGGYVRIEQGKDWWGPLNTIWTK